MNQRVLVLAGSSEASRVAQELAAQGVPAIASLAGETRAPKPLAIETRIGGFGGVDGFGAYLRDNDIGCVLDATHPFAARMTQTAAQICRLSGIPHAVLQRPGWTPATGDKWTFIDGVDDLKTLIPDGSTVFLGTGRKTLLNYEIISNCRLLARVIDPPVGPFPFADGKYLVGRPPFSVEHEVDEFTREKINWLVVKNAGGKNSESKLIAARQLGLPVALFNRPRLPNGVTVFDHVDQATVWINSVLK
jgi:precorrin-6A/cobalt-precorrin-6A reductase